MAESGAFADVGYPAAPDLTPRQRLTAIVGGAAGNLVEWYDWFAYSAFSIYFAHSFFPAGDPFASLLQAQIANIVSFLARPVGAWLMGGFADRFGRKNALVVAVLMMAAGSLATACAPTHDQIGAAAPLLLGVARLVQGLSVGGQFGAAATYMTEMAAKRRRGFWSSFHYVTLLAGLLLATLVAMALQHLMPEAAIKAGGWRIAFFIGSGLALVVLFGQLRLNETASYRNARARGEAGGAWRLVTRHPKAVLALLGLTAAGTTGFYAYTTYLTKFLIEPHNGQHIAHFSKPQATAITAVSLVVFMAAQPVVGHLADRFGRRAVMMASFGLSALFAWPMLQAISEQTAFWPAAALACAPVLLLSGYTATSAVVKAELFPAHLRALGVALPYAVANAVFGGLAEPAALSWYQVGRERWFYVYVAVLMVIGLVTATLLREPKTHSLIIED